MSLISHAIEAMGSPGGSPAPACLASSIGMWASVKDWWSVPLALKKPTEKAAGTPQYAAARRQNLRIEYALFRAILAPEVPIYCEDEDTAQLDLPRSGESAAAEPRIWARFVDTDITAAAGDDAGFIHEFEMTNASDPGVPQRHVVIVHGYMAAMGYFAQNVEAIARLYPNLVVHVIDMPGFGNSARPEFPKTLLRLPAHASRADEIAQIIAVENWFIDRLEAWRLAKKLARFDLVGHSMGAYISSCYLLKYNPPGATIVDRFVLVSPMGTESSDVSLINNRKLQFNHHDVASDPLQEVFSSHDFEHEDQHTDDWSVLWQRLGKPRFPRNAVLRALWNNHISPFQLLQTSGPFYLKLLSFWSFQRFQNLSSTLGTAQNKEDKQSKQHSSLGLLLKLHEYSFSIFNQYQASGELAITKLINHEIVPRLPLCDRGFVEYLNDAKIKTLWMYGDRDWMNSKGGEYCVEKLRGLSDPNTDLVILESAGHHIYLDNPALFNSTVVDFLNGPEAGPDAGPFSQDNVDGNLSS